MAVSATGNGIPHQQKKKVPALITLYVPAVGLSTRKVFLYQFQIKLQQ
jgi:hypothetical protein